MATQEHEQGGDRTQRTMDFTMIVLSLHHAALTALGLVEGESGEKMSADRDACRMQIDMLEVLQEKTKGNLTDDENKLMASVLYEVQMAYVKHAKS